MTGQAPRSPTDERALRLLALLLILCCAFAALAAQPPPEASAATKSCGSFRLSDTTYEIGRAGKVTCRFAKRIMRSFVVRGPGWKAHGDGTLVGTYYTNRRFRGWRCGIASRAGVCRKTKNPRTYAQYVIPPSG